MASKKSVDRGPENFPDYYVKLIDHPCVNSLHFWNSIRYNLRDVHLCIEGKSTKYRYNLTPKSSLFLTTSVNLSGNLQSVKRVRLTPNKLVPLHKLYIRLKTTHAYTNLERKRTR